MPEIRKDIIIERDAAVIFDYLTDLQKMPERLPTIKEAHPEGRPRLRLGSRFRTLSQSKGRRVEIMHEVSRFEANHLFATKTVSGTQPFEEIFELEPVDGGTRVALTASGDMPGWMRLFSGRFKKLLKKQVGNDLERLKDLLDGSPVETE